jgi:hypothetical protein
VGGWDKRDLLGARLVRDAALKAAQMCPGDPPSSLSVVEISEIFRISLSEEALHSSETLCAMRASSPPLIFPRVSSISLECMCLRRLARVIPV